MSEDEARKEEVSGLPPAADVIIIHDAQNRSILICDRMEIKEDEENEKIRSKNKQIRKY